MNAHKETAKELAKRTANAFSVNRYASWEAVALMLLGRGYTEQQVENIMRSKLTRWAADNARSTRFGRATSKDVERYIDQNSTQVDTVKDGEE